MDRWCVRPPLGLTLIQTNSVRRYSRATIDRWIRAWRRGGLDALRPETRSDTGAVRAHPELADEAAALRLELPTRSAAQISRILYARHGIRVAERTVRGQLARRGLTREALAAEPKAFGRYEADRPNERWITDVLVGPWVPHPKTPTSVRAKLFLLVDDHSRLSVHGRFFAHENARACQDTLRQAIMSPRCSRNSVLRQRSALLQCVADKDLRGARDPPRALDALFA